jgi:hypothetical protein
MKAKEAVRFMPCCGQEREALKKDGETLRGRRAIEPLAPAAPSTPPARTEREVMYRNTGNARLSVRGPVSGTVYVFPGGGAAIAVDDRDTPYLSGIGRLEEEIPREKKIKRKSWR